MVKPTIENAIRALYDFVDQFSSKENSYRSPALIKSLTTHGKSRKATDNETGIYTAGLLLTLLLDMGKYKMALKMPAKLLRFLRKPCSDSWRYYGQLALVEFYTTFFNYKAAHRYSSEVIQYARSCGNRSFELVALLSHSRILLAQHSFSQSLSCINDALDILKDDRYSHEKLDLLFAKADIFKAMGRIDLALEIVKLIEREANDRYRLQKRIESILYQGDLYLMMDDAEQAGAMYCNGFLLLQKHNIRYNNYTNTRRVARYHFKIQDYSEALKYYGIIESRLTTSIPKSYYLELRMGQAECFVALGQYNDAYNSLKEAIHYVTPHYLQHLGTFMEIVDQIIVLLPHMEMEVESRILRNLYVELNILKNNGIMNYSHYKLVEDEINSILSIVLNDKLITFSKAKLSVDLQNGNIFRQKQRKTIYRLTTKQLLVFNVLVKRKGRTVTYEEMIVSYDPSAKAHSLSSLKDKAKYMVAQINKKLHVRPGDIIESISSQGYRLKLS